MADIMLLSEGVKAGRDVSACILNYKADGTPFYNQIFISPLRDNKNKIINFVGVQVEVSFCLYSIKFYYLLIYY